MSNNLELLASWFSRHCDGSWENEHGVSIQSCDNPGWWVKIDLAGTELESRDFRPVRRGEVEGNLDPKAPWLYCYAKDNVFNGAGDVSTLEEILGIFLQWATMESR